MNKLQLLLAGLSLGSTAITVGADAYMRSEVLNYRDHVYEPTLTSIIITTLNEEAYLSETLASLENQNVMRWYPKKFETIVVDGGSQDGTLTVAKNFRTRILTISKGKLTARHVGIIQAKGKIMVGVDADTYYPPNYLNLISKEFRDPHVVGVATPRLFSRDSNIIFNTVAIWRSLADGTIGGRMPGSNSAFRKDAYQKVGGFNLSINQFNSKQMVQEEEYDFPNRLRKIGKVAWLWKAPAYTSARRWINPTTEARSFKEPNDYLLLYPE